LRKFKNTPGTIVTRARARMDRNAQGRLRVAHIGVDIELPEAASEYLQLERLLQQFENFCVVTESVRSGIAVDVTVRDPAGKLLHGSAELTG
jgi:organic hydroperoxide reductase OsmC/OhrA